MAIFGLNLLWAVLCFSAVVFQLRADARQATGFRIRLRRGLAMFLAIVALFPCVSASDDSARIEYLNAAARHHNSSPLPESSQDKSLATLVRLFEVLESAQVSILIAIATTLFFFALVCSLQPASIDRRLPALPGRGPPSFDSSL